MDIDTPKIIYNLKNNRFNPIKFAIRGIHKDWNIG